MSIDILVSISIFIIFLILLIFSPLGTIFIFCSLIQFLTKSKISRVLAWFFQSLIFLITLFLEVLWMGIKDRVPEKYWQSLVPPEMISYHQSFFIGGLIAWIVFLLGMFSIMLWQIFFQLKIIKSEKEKTVPKVPKK